MWPSATPAVKGLVPGKLVFPKCIVLCPVHTAAEALHDQSCTVQGRVGPIPPQMSFSSLPERVWEMPTGLVVEGWLQLAQCSVPSCT